MMTFSTASASALRLRLRFVIHYTYYRDWCSLQHHFVLQQHDHFSLAGDPYSGTLDLAVGRNRQTSAGAVRQPLSSGWISAAHFGRPASAAMCRL